jgi:hypothetical protein
MHYLPIPAWLKEDSRKTALYDCLITLFLNLSREEYQINYSTSALILDSLVADGRDKTVRSLISLLDNEDSENKNHERIMPYISILFKGLAGRCLFMSKGVYYLGIGPGDIVAGDVIVRFAGVKQPLFFRPKDGKHEVLGDGSFMILEPGFDDDGKPQVLGDGSFTILEPELDDSEAEIVLV